MIFSKLVNNNSNPHLTFGIFENDLDNAYKRVFDKFKNKLIYSFCLIKIIIIFIAQFKMYPNEFKRELYWGYGYNKYIYKM